MSCCNAAGVSFAHTRWLMFTPLKLQPVSPLLRSSNLIYVHTLLNTVDNIPPWGTPLDTRKPSDNELFHRTLNCCVLYQLHKIHIAIVGMPLSSNLPISLQRLIVLNALDTSQ